MTGTADLDREICAGCYMKAMLGADRRDAPYTHWLLSEALPEETVRELAAIKLDATTPAKYDGTRELNNASRTHFNPAFRAQHSVADTVAKVFDSDEVRELIVGETGAKIDDAALRIEMCHDRDGFWLEPHKDISVKRFTMLIYLSDDPDQADCGTDVYEEDEVGKPRWVGRSPFGPGQGLIFIPGADTWHGYDPRPIAGVRKSIIVNYVGPEWRAKEELA